MASQNPSISLHVKLTVAPESVDKFLEALKPAYDAVIAEPKCTFFEVFQNPNAPGEFKFIENWDATVDWLQNVQLKKEYYKPYLAATEPLWLKPREMELWERMPGPNWVSVSKENLPTGYAVS
ncbi:hypothetical protein EJ04DRAFT_511002 [Polyplosphaeria fusca]|uniref:ABM domain-containing protein n=1 Tax=Polyplosphaeria fusca TaxID=682080 RepID=A0A9P4V5L4_9PLEO|nr:hypothetical protein EJ04DRAFT_511002 [Polyplosphaeria fusca]